MLKKLLDNVLQDDNSYNLSIASQDPYRQLQCCCDPFGTCLAYHIIHWRQEVEQRLVKQEQLVVKQGLLRQNLVGQKLVRGRIVKQRFGRQRLVKQRFGRQRLVRGRIVKQMLVKQGFAIFD
ncbi:hypothetical protein Rs2_38785 [Raphanus sativus]|nr:hypothetical protein Rs2_38785 [Raphanus sativus]